MINIDSKYIDIILNLVTKYFPDCEIWAYGSRIKGTNTEKSDLDILLIDKSKLDFIKLGQLKEDLQESEIPFEVDIHDWYRLSEEFKNIIKQNYIILKKK